MNNTTLSTPVVLIVFNRPETTRAVFERIAEARPSQFFIVADGPRSNRPDDAEKCAATRAIVERVDWPSEVVKHYSEVNLGCGLRPASGISRIFEQVDRAIILEDDCVPHPTFFRFCEELLEKYRDDERVMHIAGNNLQFGRQRGEFSYFFSRHNLCHGWATWRRAWRHFDMGIPSWPELRSTKWLPNIVDDARAVSYWQRMFDQAHEREGNIDYWDYQWTFACWAQSGLSILPNRTLITNIGFGGHATHTKSARDPRANLALEAIEFPLKHPPSVIQNHAADQFLVARVVASLPKNRSVIHKIMRKMLALVPHPVQNRLSLLRSKVHSGSLDAAPE